MNQIHLWSDGSSVNNGKEKGIGGYGYILLFGDFSDVDITKEYGDPKRIASGWEGSENTTNQREEMKAIINGLKKIKESASHYPIQVFSDSAYIVNCMKQRWYDKWRINGWKNSKNQPVENQDLWEELLETIEDRFLKIKWVKIKGHSGVFYNEMCDQLANLGLKKMRELRKG